ncbi:DUF6292 family protein [Streptomyces sp. 2-1]|uniref:DUF6292 family protein n=1 Tax=Streptomyces sp. 2-1 TaxID=412710 RepID=UPI003AFB7FAD
MLLNPPGLLPAGSLPHWPYAQAIDQALTAQGIPPGIVRVERTYRMRDVTMYLVLIWDVSRCAGLGGIQLTWQEDSGWSHALLRGSPGSALLRGPLAALHRVFAPPEAVADVAGSLVSRHFSNYEAQWHGEWNRAQEVRPAIDAFRCHF